MGFGLAGLLLGYVPLVFTSAVPTVDEINGRLNSASALGAPLLLVGMFAVAIFATPIADKSRRPLLVIVLTSLAMVAVLREMHVAGDFQGAWQAQQHFWRVALPTIARLSDASVVVIAAPHASDWDTIYEQPQVGAASVVRLALRGGGPGVFLAYRPDLRACGVLRGHAAGGRLLVAFRSRGIVSADSHAVIPYSRVSIILYDSRASTTIREVRGRFMTAAPNCFLTGGAPTSHGMTARTIWGFVATGSR